MQTYTVNHEAKLPENIACSILQNIVLPVCFHLLLPDHGSCNRFLAYELFWPQFRIIYQIFIDWEILNSKINLPKISTLPFQIHFKLSRPYPNMFWLINKQ